MSLGVSFWEIVCGLSSLGWQAGCVSGLSSVWSSQHYQLRGLWTPKVHHFDVSRTKLQAMVIWNSEKWFKVVTILFWRGSVSWQCQVPCWRLFYGELQVSRGLYVVLRLLVTHPCFRPSARSPAPPWPSRCSSGGLGGSRGPGQWPWLGGSQIPANTPVSQALTLLIVLPSIEVNWFWKFETPGFSMVRVLYLIQSSNRDGGFFVVLGFFGPQTSLWFPRDFSTRLCVYKSFKLWRVRLYYALYKPLYMMSICAYFWVLSYCADFQILTTI